MIVLDAAVAVALLNSTDVHYGTAVTLLAESLGESFVMHRLNLAEVLVVPARAGLETEARDDLFRIGVSVADIGDDEPLLFARPRASYGLKMPDTCALAVTLHYGAQLATFDKRLDTARNRALRAEGT